MQESDNMFRSFTQFECLKVSLRLERNLHSLFDFSPAEPSADIPEKNQTFCKFSNKFANFHLSFFPPGMFFFLPPVSIADSELG